MSDTVAHRTSAAGNKPAAELLATPVQFVKGVGPDRAKLLERIGLRTAADVLFNFPRDYQDLSDLRSIDALEEDKLQSVRGTVEEIDMRSTGMGRSIVGMLLRHDQRYLRAIWFNMPFMADKFRRGQQVLLSGKPKLNGGRWEMTHPRAQWIDAEEGSALSGELLPVYALTDELKQSAMRRIARQAVDAYVDSVEERFPAEYLARHGLWPIAQSLREIHFPTTKENLQQARRRFIYQEMLILQLAMALKRNVQETRRQAPPLEATAKIDARITRLFPFELTAAQKQATQEIAADMARPVPMNRLLQGDVGCGKTVVAVYAMLLAVAHGCQAALMAPTEVLARQHAETVEQYLAQSRVRRLLLTGGLSPRERREALKSIRDGEIDLVIGTQALVQEDVQFAKLGLVVIDEQHKFGVHQRARARRLGVDPHYLVMTATPIPRTAALTVFGDLDVSIIREPPPGRHLVKTRWLKEEQRPRLYDYLRKQLAAKRQAFVVCPLVEESAALQARAATEMHAELASGPFKDLRVGLLHGRQDEATKTAVMAEFRAGRTDLLVCTSVVEVGVDVPNATLLVVEHAERFGLSQLHQLRGRISRGSVAGECYLFADPGTDEARERLNILTRTTDGFRLAEEDLRLRGLGEFFGARQHGLGELRLGSLIADADLLTQARKDAFALVLGDAGLRKPEHAWLRAAVLQRYGATLDLAEVG